MSKGASWFSGFKPVALVCALLVGVAIFGLRQSSSAAPQFGSSKGAVVGIEFDGRMVSDLDKSVAFYKALGFVEVPNLDKSWRNDAVMNRIHGTKGVESRMAKFTLNSNISGKPFTLYLREFRGIKRRNVMKDKTAWEPGATHIDLTIPDAEKTWADLKAANMLWPRTWDGKLMPLPGATKGTLAYITDPDGMDVEIIEQRPAIPATDTRPAVPADLPGFNHIGLVVLDPDKARAFYGVMLGAQWPTAPVNWIGGDFFDSAVGGHGNVIRLANATFAEAADPKSRMRFEIVEYENRKKPLAPYSITDIGVNYIGLECTDIDSLLARLKGFGVTVVSDGIVEMKTGYRVVLVRDPDVGAFVELFERPKS
ncbi:MAG: VOC family protein [Acidobacteriia bacterium]|nr:VOC family protein [Terriglobia bacterium]